MTIDRKGSAGPDSASLIDELDRVDRAVFAAVAATPTPHLDAAMRRISDAANYSKPWIAASAIMALVGGPRGRCAAASGIVSVAVTSAVANLISKRLLGRRPRPDREAAEVPLSRHVRMPGSGSFPSGHAASAVAFASGVARVVPAAGLPLRVLAAVVAYSRVHTGVHYPGDVLAGAVLGAAVADVTADAVTRRLSPC
jgi:undecaprenyl-diphosphatase